jgi:eukaryotic-like serine/threonine-protein kinase
MQSSALNLEPGTLLAGKLRIIRIIGEGGMGAVYEVEHEFTKHRRALKLLHPDLAMLPGIVARFHREASAAGRIGSPHIVETFDAGTLDTGEPYIVMELLDGKPLGDVIAHKGRLDFLQSLEILRQSCEAIQAAHDAGIVHRDLKPENLFLLNGSRTFVKVLDFGISKFDPARTMDGKLTQDGATMGTPYYMSPEQVRGQSDLDGRTDVYALGVVLYECLTGRKPFAAETLPAIAVLIHEGKYEPLRALRPEAPPELEAVVARAIAVDRDSRFATPGEFARALSAIDLAAAIASAGRRELPSATEADGTPLGVMSTRPAFMAAELAAARAAETPAAAAAPAEGSAAQAGSSSAVQAGTDAGVASDTAGGDKRGVPKVAWLGAAALVIGLGVGWVMISRQGSSGSAAHPEEAPSAPASTGPSVIVTPTVSPTATVTTAPAPPEASGAGPQPSGSRPTVTPHVGISPMAPSALPSPSASAAKHERHPDGKVSPGALPTASATPSRANQHGLAEDNPFQ